MISPAEIIDAKGGPTAFAAKVKRRPGAVRAWKHRNYFPREAWPEIINAFPDLALEKLIEIEAWRGRIGKATESVGSASNASQAKSANVGNPPKIIGSSRDD
jgi:hypothetical protein